MRRKKSLFFIVLTVFVGITNYAFIHHMVFEEHDIDYHIVKDKAEAHDHCTVCKIADQHTTFLDSDFLPLVDLIVDQSVINRIIKSSHVHNHILLRGPPQLVFQMS